MGGYLARHRHIKTISYLLVLIAFGVHITFDVLNAFGVLICLWCVKLPLVCQIAFGVQVFSDYQNLG